MKVLMLVLYDGYYCKGPMVPSDFDTQAWAQNRLKSFNLLRVVRIEEIHVI